MGFLHDDYSIEDLLGHKFARDALVDLIESVSTKAKSSFTIGIFGDWGSGKTTMLRQIESAVKVNPEVVTVWFNPWQFSKDDDIIRAFFQLLAERLDEATRSKESAIGSAFRKFSDHLKKAATARRYRTDSMEVGLPILFKLKWARDPNQVESADSLESLIDKFEAAHGSIYYDMIRFLRSALSGADGKIVVFIDDLDRCMPDQAIKLLEGLKVLLDIPNFIFVVGVAHKIIEWAIQKRYRDFFGESSSIDEVDRVNYLDKIFQFSFVLPHPDGAQICENIIKPALPEIENKSDYADIILSVVGSNPRSIKRFLNVLQFALSLAANRFAETAPDFVRILKVSLIAFVMPDLHRWLERIPVSLVTINKAVGSFDNSKNDDMRSALLTGNELVDRHITNQAAVKLHQILRFDDQTHGFTDQSTARQYLQVASSSLITSASPFMSTCAQPPAGRGVSQFVEIREGVLALQTAGEKPLRIRIKKALYVGKYLVTQALYQSVMNSNPSGFIGESLPVESVSWFDAVRFCNAFSQRNHLDEVYAFSDSNESVSINYDANGFRLPTEAEWEYFCAAESFSDLEIDEYAWYMNNSSTCTQPVGLKAPNVHGMYDVLGNVWEWCNDWYSVTREVSGDDPIGPIDGHEKICRGGSWANFKNVVNAAYRGKKNPHALENNIGFRIVTRSRPI